MRIVTDCAADLTPEEAQTLGVIVAPLYIQFPEGEADARKIAPDDFYRRLEAMQPRIPTTAQPSPDVFARIYDSLCQTGEQVLSIHISSGLSGTANSARLAASQLAAGTVHVLDSLTLSGGQRFQVLAAARAARAGWTLQTILERLESIRQQTEVVYTLESLAYLARGGRIGRVQALAGSLLGFKPIIHVERADGKYSSLGRARTIRRALEMLADHLAQLYARTPVWVSVMHGRFAEPARALADLLGARLNVSRLETLRISPVLGVHTGPGIVGATVAPLQLVEDTGG